VPAYDYKDTQGTLHFGRGETEQTLTVEVLPWSQYKVCREFVVILASLDEAAVATFDSESDGGPKEAILTVVVQGMPSTESPLLRRLDALVNLSSIQAGNAQWFEQIRSCLLVHGSWDGQKEATVRDWLFHIICVPWKMCCALVPATRYFGGWACFFGSLCAIAFVTGMIADLAELFGCVCEVSDSVTAITFVALGTSMPDLFASKTTATQDDSADAAIVNVTGSNTVNVFLGLGLPWSMGAVYWAFRKPSQDWKARYKDIVPALTSGNVAKFVVEGQALGFSVLIFAICCFSSIFLLVFRRKYLGCELGGPSVPKIASAAAFLLYWFMFVALVSWHVSHRGPHDGVDVASERPCWRWYGSPHLLVQRGL